MIGSRRRFLSALAASAAAAAVSARAQPAPIRIAWTSPTRASDGSPFLDELRRGLAELGHVDGRNIVITAYWGEDSAERFAQLMPEIIASAPHVIVAQGATAPPMRKATSTIPIVFAYSGDPVQAGLVQSLSRPGGNMTGISYLALDLVAKRMELVKEVLPAARRVAILAQPQHPGDQGERRASQAAATALGLQLSYFESRNTTQLFEALAAIEKSGSQAVVMFPVQNIMLNRSRIAEWSLKSGIPTVSGWAQFADGGNFMSYGPNLREATRRLAVYVDRILNGAKPADMPVELPTRVELVINLKAAAVLGVKVPHAVLLRADRIIQ